MCGLFTTVTVARENAGASGSSNNKNGQPSTMAATCNATTAQAELDINNIRTTILVGGDLWWNLDEGRYEVPIGSGKHSLFAGSLWIGGIDAGGQIKVAAQTYRQTGYDFWGGPIDTVSVSTTDDRCQAFDRHWKVTKDQVREFIADNSKATNDIKSWPGNGSDVSNEGQFLAPFKDVDGDGVYDYRNGDYPYYLLPDLFPNDQYPTIPGTPKVECNDYLFGDETIWWVFNDVGNIHSETGSDPIGLEIRAQAFAFKTNDEINNMTFYKYQIINRSSNTLTQTYFGQWVDPDLGNYTDDYVGCDVPRGLGFCYNGDADDDGGAGYGANPPAIGVDFFQGPIADKNDGVDNDRDGCVDCTVIGNDSIDDDILGEQIIMSKFVYYNNDNSPFGNPSGFADFYNYLRGIWRDNQPITYGADGRDPNAPPCNFMFPGTTDPANPTNWTEFSVGNPPADRRFLQSAGTFTLTPGAVNYVTTGVVWARAQQGGPQASIDLMKLADDKAQALFDNCFKLIDGPNAPDLVIRELDKKFIFSLQNYNTSAVELYSQEDPTIVGVADSLKTFDFQGYQIYQFRDATVTTADIGNPDKVRLLFQCDIQDGVAQLVNFEFDASLNANVPIEKVNGADEGIKHVFVVNQDLFATGSSALVNHKTYYYSVISYAYNQYKKYDPNDPTALDGQKKPYLAGRNNIKTYAAIPQNPSLQNGGQIFGAEVGEGPIITRIEGQGNGGMLLDFANDYTNELINPPYRIKNPTYKAGNGPLNLQVYDPVLVSRGNYVTRFSGVAPSSTWQMVDADADTVLAERGIGENNQQVIPEWGLTAEISTIIEAGRLGAANNGFLGSSIEYSNPSKAWLNSIVDVDDTEPNPENWIRAGSDPTDIAGDSEGIYETVVGGTWAPLKLTANTFPGPKPPSSALAEAQILLSPATTAVPPLPQVQVRTGLSSVDIVITADKSKWSRSPVIEIGGGTTGVGTLGSMGTVSITSGGSGYTSAPTVTVSGDGSGVLATANLATTGSVKFVTVNDPGTGYPASSTIPVVFTGGGGNGATGSAVIDANGSVDTILITNGGTAYATAPSVSITDPNGTGFTGTSTLGYAVASITVTNTGSGFSAAPTITISGDGSGATASALLSGAKAFELRRSPSIDKNGNPDGSGFGMSWFPGYAVNIETGERLNIAFGENSALAPQHNSRDMKWNPTASTYDETTGDTVFGGMHYIYVFGHNSDGFATINVGGVPTLFPKDIPMYDEGKSIYDLLRLGAGQYPGVPANAVARRDCWKDAMWVSLPKVAESFSSLSLPDQIPSDAKVRLRVARTYRPYATGEVLKSNQTLTVGTLYYVVTAPVVHSGSTYTAVGDTFTAADTVFTGYGTVSSQLSPNSLGSFAPMYNFNTDDLANTTNVSSIAQSALGLISVVPNPYYAFSAYETSQLDNRIRILNLPSKCTVSIFTVGGTLVRKFNRDAPADNSAGQVFSTSVPTQSSSLDWDLKNIKGIPIASGVYLIHIEAPGIGEKTIKWFGMTRPLDLDTF
jgi:hypothetical protein